MFSYFCYDISNSSAAYLLCAGKDNISVKALFTGSFHKKNTEFQVFEHFLVNRVSVI